MTTVPPISQPAALEQRTFRAMLSAMSMPGTVEVLTNASSAAISTDSGWDGVVAIAQSFLDHEVTFHVAVANGTAVEDAILRRTGARTASLDRAGYVFVDAANAKRAVDEAVEGGLEEPERSATVVIRCGSVGEGDLVLRLSGPGIDGETVFHIGGLDRAVIEARNERNGPFPTGIDLLLVDGEGRVAGLPRSTQVELLTPATAGATEEVS